MQVNICTFALVICKSKKNKSMENQNQIAIKTGTDAFKTQLKRASKLLEDLSDEQILQEIAPTKNTGHYLFGHLLVVHDYMFPLLGLGEALYPELAEIFVKNPDKSGLEKPSVAQIRQQWNVVHTLLLEKIDILTSAQWLEKHTAVSDEDFAKEPHRNRLNVLLNRTNHLAYHLGQLVLLKK